ncbi:hypothetical protein [Olleya marilimosa]|nr:hypothetical protein [Olleya marilimosa]
MADTVSESDKTDSWLKYLKSKNIEVCKIPLCVVEYNFYNSNK